VLRLLPIASLTILLVACGEKPADDAGAPALSKSESAAPTPTSSATGPATSADEAAIEKALSSPGAPVVDLAGNYNEPPPIPEGAPRLAVRALSVPVFAKANDASKTIGYLRAGAVVQADATDFGKAGCPGGWRGIYPAGFVCLGDKVTENLNDPIVLATQQRPDLSQKLPYIYGTVTRGGPVYARIPTEADIEQFEPGLAKHIKKWRDDEVSGASYGNEIWHKWKSAPTLSAWDAWEAKTTDADIPAYLQGGSFVPNLSGLAKPGVVKIDQVDRRQGAAFIDSFLSKGRRYNVTTDLRVAPADRYRPIKGSDLHGVRIGVDVEFPFALIRKKGARKWLWSASKKKMIEDGDLAYRAAVQLTGKQQIVKDILHYETKDGFWVDDRHASRLDPVKRMPKWGKNGEKWMDVNITKQTLLALEGEKAVFATLISAGEDGLLEGKRATKKGIFRVHTKYVSTTMDSDTVGEEFELRDVPYVQYFEEGFALHGAYWHDSFGTPKSHGCINLAPEDARRLFQWTEPAVPPAWHGAAKPLTGTVLFIHP